MLIHHSCLCSRAPFGQGQPKPGVWRAQQLLPQRPEVGCTTTEDVWTRSMEVPTQDREDWLCGVSLPGRAVSTVSGDEIELIVQIMAKPHEESVWLESMTEVIRRSSKTTAADWLKAKAAAAALRWPGKRSRVCKLDFPLLHLTVPTGLKRKTLRGAGGCVWE